MRQYNDFTDEELVIRARDGEEEITEIGRASCRERV